MAVITQDTFDPLKAWISVRLQQGVPIVDADWNEADDARRFELRSYLKWHVGDGVPEGNDGFRVTQAAAPVAANFLIRTNAVIPLNTPNLDAALRLVGRCLVDGLDVIITADTQFTAQPLHPSQGGSAVLAAAWGVPLIDATPLAANVPTLAVYLDVWERLVTPTEAPSMILPALGIESAARRRREWVVRVAVGSAAPAPAAGHSHYVLALITRPANVPVAIVNANLTDRREQRLLTPPSTLITDTFGGTVADYRRGIGRPGVSLRSAINSLLRGQMAGPPEGYVDVVPNPALPLELAPTLFLDRAGGLLVLWTATDFFTVVSAFVARLDLSNPGTGFSTPPVKLNQGVFQGFFPSGVVLPNGDLLIAYVRSPNISDGDILYRRASSLATLLAAPEQTVWASPSTESEPLVILAGNIVVFFFKSANQWRYRRWNHVTNTWLDGAPLTPPNPTANSLHAAADPAGNIWVAMDPSAGLNVFRLNPGNNLIDASFTFTPGTPGDYDYPKVLMVGTVPWVFWRSPQGIPSASYTGAWAGPVFVPGTSTADTNVDGAIDESGQLLLTFPRQLANSQSAVYALSASPATGAWAWGLPMLLAPCTGSDIQMNFSSSATLVSAPGRGFWSVWIRLEGSRYAIMYRQVFPTI